VEEMGENYGMKEKEKERNGWTRGTGSEEN
jgi:hypothetical protein